MVLVPGGVKRPDRVEVETGLTDGKVTEVVSGLDEVSFHMSGTEAVMQAVRLARYHTGRSHLVRFCGAYHGNGFHEDAVKSATVVARSFGIEL